MQAQREVVRFLLAYQETWHRFFPDLHRRGQWHLVSHLCVRARDGSPVGELSGLVKQVFLLDDATVRERLGELYRLGFCAIEPADRPVSARTLVLPTPLLTAKFDGHLIETATNLLQTARAFRPSPRGSPPAQIDLETRRRLLGVIERCDEAWVAALERMLESMGLSMARRLEARRHLLSPSHRMLTLLALRHWYGLSHPDAGDGMLADDMAAELLRLQRQNLQTTRDHIAALTQLGLLERRAGRALRVALAEPVAAELDRGMAQAVDDLLRVAAGFVRDGTDDMEQTGLAHALPEISGADASAGFHVLLVSRAGEPDQRIALGTEPLVIGRAPSNGLILVAHEVSRAHCRVALVANEVNVTDLDSTNGTYVDGKRIAHTTVLLPGAVLQVGPYRMICQPLANQDVEGTMRPIAPAMPVAVSDGAP